MRKGVYLNNKKCLGPYKNMHGQGNSNEYKTFIIAASEFQIVASTASMLEEPSLILVNKLPIAFASILLASNCLRNRLTQFETLNMAFHDKKIYLKFCH